MRSSQLLWLEDNWPVGEQDTPAAGQGGFWHRISPGFEYKISTEIQTEDFTKDSNTGFRQSFERKISPVFEYKISLEFKHNISQEFWKYYCARALNMSMISYDSININMIFIFQNFVPTRG